MEEYEGKEFSSLVINLSDRAQKPTKFVRISLPDYGGSLYSDDKFHNAFLRGRNPKNLPLGDLIALIKLFRDDKHIPLRALCSAAEAIELFSYMSIKESERHQFFGAMVSLFPYYDLESAYRNKFNVSFPYYLDESIPPQQKQVAVFSSPLAQSIRDLYANLSVIRISMKLATIFPELKIEEGIDLDNELPKTLVNLTKIPDFTKWLAKLGRIFRVLSISEVEESDTWFASYLFLLHTLYLLEATYRRDFDQNIQLYKKLLFSFLEIFPSEANRNGNDNVIHFLSSRVFRLEQNEPLRIMFNRWYGGIEEMAFKILLTYPIEEMSGFTSSGSDLTVEFVRMLIRNIRSWNHDLSLELERVSNKGFNLEVVESLEIIIWNAMVNINQ